MLDIKTFLSGIDRAQREIDKLSEPTRIAVRNGLENSARGIYAEMFKLLNGPNRTPVTKKKQWVATGYRLVKRKGRHSFEGPPGSYPPVSVITGHLKGRLGWMGPNESKNLGGSKTYNVDGRKITKYDPNLSITTNDDEVIIYNSAAYAQHVNNTRPFIEDGFQRYGGIGQVVQDIENEFRPLFGR